MTIAPLSYNPDPTDTQVTAGTGIGITFDHRILAGSGNVTLSVATNAGAAGTTVENFGVGSSVTIQGRKASIDPTSDLTTGETYHISYPSGAFTNTGGDVDYVGTAYTFGVKPLFETLWVWGNNQYGNLGQNNKTERSSPIQIGTDTDWKTFSACYEQTCFGIRTNGTLWSWGYNGFGVLGINGSVNARRSSPTQIPGTTWSQFHGRRGAASAIKTDGTLWMWGRNSTGQLGQNNKTYYSSPVQIPGTSWSTANTGSSSFAIRTDGTLWAWGGENNYGQSGLNDKSARSSPVQIPGTTWEKVYTAGLNASAIRTDGTLWTWGRNASYGCLGQNNETNYSSPVQIPGTTWKNIGHASNWMTAVKTDGTLWGWGKNDKGQLGQNSRTDYSSPVQVGSATDWSAVNNLAKGTMAVKTDGTAYVWGRGGNGQLGQNIEDVAYSSPVQLPGTDWSTDWEDLGGNWSESGSMGAIRHE